MRAIITSDKFIADVVRRLVKDYNRIEVVRDEANSHLIRVVATCPSAWGDDDLGDSNPVVPASLPDPPPNCS